jgi:CHAD domain-containing protein
METAIYALPDRFDFDGLKEGLQAAFHLAEERRRAFSLEVFDTFDWRLYARGQLLVREGAVLKVLEAPSDREVIRAAISPRQRPRFWWDLPESPLRQVLREVLDVRALRLLARLRQGVRTLDLRNAEEKTVARVVWEAVARAGKHASREPLAQVCKLVPVRGYRQEWAAAARALASCGIDRQTGGPIVLALKASGHRPGGYAPKADIPLWPEMPAGAAARAILAHLGQVMGANEDGIRRDIDTEFLHDFRVAVRRARSLLSLLPGVFDPQGRHALKAGLQAAGRVTTGLRDLDVYLLQQPRYEALLPDRLRPAIAPLFASLKRRRGRERRKTLAFLDAGAYRELRGHLNEGTSAVADLERLAPDPARGPIKPLADRVIFKHYRKIIKAGRRIGGSTPDSDLHRLRIECKKLRYAIEFFATLYPAAEIQDLIKQLKSLQDNLGRFNDLAVQQEFLHTFLARLDGRTPGAIGLAAAIGALIGRLHREHDRVREAFREVFAAFQAPDNHLRYVRLFAAPGEPA